MARNISGDKIVVTGEESGALFPTNREECYKDVYVDGTNKFFNVNNSAFSPNLKMSGAGTIRGAVFASKNLRLENDGNLGVQCFLSGLSSHDSIIAESLGDNKITSGVSNGIENAKFVVRGDIVCGNKVSLQNTVVIGSVYANLIELHNSIVFGTVKAENSLKATCSGLGMFRAKRVDFNGPTKIYTASGFSLDEPTFNSYEELETDYPCKLYYDPLCRFYKIAIEDWLSPELSQNADDIDKVLLKKRDFIKVDNTQAISKIFNNVPVELEGYGRLQTAYFLGIEGRALNMSPVYDNNKAFNTIINGIFAYEHLINEKREELKKIWNEYMSKEEVKIMNLVTNGI